MQLDSGFMIIDNTPYLRISFQIVPFMWSVVPRASSCHWHIFGNSVGWRQYYPPLRSSHFPNEFWARYSFLFHHQQPICRGLRRRHRSCESQSSDLTESNPLSYSKEEIQGKFKTKGFCFNEVEAIQRLNISSKD